MKSDKRSRRNFKSVVPRACGRKVVAVTEREIFQKRCIRCSDSSCSHSSQHYLSIFLVLRRKSLSCSASTQALIALFDALQSGDAGRVEPLLAPEFQVVRSDGRGYEKQQYLRQSIPKILRPPTFEDLIVTRNSDIVVTRMKLHIDEEIDGKGVESGAPQLIVFRITQQGWQVVAAANFARLIPVEHPRRY